MLREHVDVPVMALDPLPDPDGRGAGRLVYQVDGLGAEARGQLAASLRRLGERSVALHLSVGVGDRGVQERPARLEKGAGPGGVVLGHLAVGSGIRLYRGVFLAARATSSSIAAPAMPRETVVSPWIPGPGMR